MPRASWHIVLFVVFAAVVGGCDDEVVDAEKTDRAFTLYGYLDPRSDLQGVRVFPIQHALEPIGPTIDASVVYVDLETGAVHPATDSVIAFLSGEYGHVFNAPFRPRYGSPYRVEVARSDGARASAEVTVPSDVDVEEDDIFITRNAESPEPRPHLPLFLKGEPTWIAAVTAIYDVEILELFATRQLRLSYDYRPEQVAGGWRVAVDLTTDFERILDLLSLEFGGVVRDYQIHFLRLRLEADVVNEGWYPPTGRFDGEILVEPGVMTNVENGFGFVGSGYRITHQLEPAPCLLSWAGYYFPSDPCTREEWCTYAGARCP